MDEKYSKLFGLYKKSRMVFHEAVERIGPDPFDFNLLCSFLLEKQDPCVLDGTRWILLTHFTESLSIKILQNFRDISGDRFVQEKALAMIEKRYIEENALSCLANEVVAMFSS